MKLILSGINITHPKIFKELKSYIDPNIINELNDADCIYKGKINVLKELNICKFSSECGVETIVSRMVGNVAPHYDNIPQFKRDVYLLVLDVSKCGKYNDSQQMPLLYQRGKFIELKTGMLVKFNQNIDHALFWDQRIDIATFWLQ